MWAPKIRRKIGYNLNMYLLIVLHWLSVSYPIYNGHTTKSVHFRATHVNWLLELSKELKDKHARI